jgi:RimJ/RimL family protein N-acetyltransferase
MPPPHPFFAFEILGPEHNDSDLAAWSSSIEHIRSSPGWAESTWPSRVYSGAENLADLTEHRDHHERRIDFAWTVLDPATREVIGCVYLTPPRNGREAARAQSWVRADRAELDVELRTHLGPWWVAAWPVAVHYPGEVRR